MDFILSILLCE